MKVDGGLKSLLQGVSQQPARDRLPGQCTEQINMSSDPVQGLSVRPPTDLVGFLSPAALSSWYDFTTRDGKRWLAQFTVDANVFVKDLNCIPAPLTIGATARAYINGSQGKLRFATVDEKTYVVNPEKRVNMFAAAKQYWNSPQSNVAGIVQILGGNYGRTYSILVDGVVRASYTTPDGSEKNHALFVKTSWIAAQLYQALVSALPSFLIRVADDVIAISAGPGTAQFRLSVTDDAGNINAKAFTTQVKAISELSRFAPAGYVVRVASHADPDDDVFYRFVLEQNTEDYSGGGFGLPGYWQETVAPATYINFEYETMPCVLEYNPDTSSFTFNVVAWQPRKSGTYKSNPAPSFVGNTIQDAGIFQGRLVFVAGDSVIMSRTNHYDDFWIASVGEQADTDPIDISSNSVEAAFMQSIIPHNKDLVIFSAKGQFIVYGRTSITPKNAALVLSTSFEAELRAKPVPSGRNVFFATNYGGYTNIREFYTEGGTDINDTRPITQHVRKYIEGSITKLAASSNYDTLIAIADRDKSCAYVYQYIWSDSEKVQSSWSKWKFENDIEYIFFTEELIYFVLNTFDGWVLSRMSLDVQDAEGVGYPAYLDSRFDVFNVDRAFVLPFNFLSIQDIVVVQGAGCPHPGLRAEILSQVTVPNVATTVTLKRSMAGGRVVVGTKYRRVYEPTMPGVKDGDGTIMGTGKLRIKNWLVTVDETGEFYANVKSKFYASSPIYFSGRIIGDPINLPAEQPLYSGTVSIPFREDARYATFSIESDGHLPMNLLDIEYVGQYTKKGRRINGGNSIGG